MQDSPDLAVLDRPAKSQVKEYTVQHVCFLIGKSDSALRRWIADGRIPRPYRVGQELRWRVETIDAWQRAGYPRQTA